MHSKAFHAVYKCTGSETVQCWNIKHLYIISNAHRPSKCSAIGHVYLWWKKKKKFNRNKRLAKLKPWHYTLKTMNRINSIKNVQYWSNRICGAIWRWLCLLYWIYNTSIVAKNNFKFPNNEISKIMLIYFMHKNKQNYLEN